MNLAGKAVLITGASGGIGKAAALKFAEEGASLVLSYNRDTAALTDLKKSLSDKKASFLTIQADISQVDDIKKLFAKIKEHYKKIDVLVNMAGIEPVFDDPLDTKQWEKVFAVNLFAPVECTREAVKLMGKGSVIVNISSVAGKMGTTDYFDAVSYAISKAALNKFTEVCAYEFAPKIRVVSIEPGYVKTPMWHITDKQEEEFAKKVPIKRFIQPGEIADLIVHVCKNEAINGTCLTIDGALSLKALF